MILGIADRGLWAKAWYLSRVTGEQVEDCFQELVVTATEIVAEEPEITEQSPGYLLQKAAWLTQNKISKANHTYMKRTHNIQVLSLDAELDTSRGSHHDHHEAVAAPSTSQDDRIAVEQVIGRLDTKLQKVARMLMEGYRKSEVARALGVSPAAVTGYVKALRAEFSAAGGWL